jgi:hypothetical protein
VRWWGAHIVEALTILGPQEPLPPILRQTVSPLCPSLYMYEEDCDEERLWEARQGKGSPLDRVKGRLLSPVWAPPTLH